MDGITRITGYFTGPRAGTAARGLNSGTGEVALQRRPAGMISGQPSMENTFLYASFLFKFVEVR